MRLAVVLALASAGCNLVFPLREGVPDDAEVVPPEELPKDAGCVDDDIDEDFTAPAGNPCGDGMVIGQGVSEQSGQLRILPLAGLGQSAGCRTTTTIPFTAVSVEVAAVPVTNGMFAALTISDGSQLISLATVRKNAVTVLGLRVDGVEVVTPVTYSAVQHRHWRLRANGDNTDVDVSADGVVYQPLFVAEAPKLSTVGIELTAGAPENTSVTSPTEARFDNLAGCP